MTHHPLRALSIRPAGAYLRRRFPFLQTHASIHHDDERPPILRGMDYQPQIIRRESSLNTLPSL